MKKRSLLYSIFPEKVTRYSTQFSTTFYLGVIQITLLVLLLISGIVLLLFFVPGKYSSFQSIIALTGGGIPLGSFFRDLHRFSAESLIVVTVLHLISTFTRRGYIKGRKFIWIIGYISLGLILISSFTGYIMLGTREGYWQAKVGSELIEKIPLLGNGLKQLLLAGDEIGDNSYYRFYSLHIISSIIVYMVVIFHLWQLRSGGGLYKPPRVTGSKLKEEINFFPEIFQRYLSVVLTATILILLLTIFFDAPIGTPAFPVQIIDSPKAPWYFLWIQELMRLGTWFGGTVVSCVIVIFLSIPYLDRDNRKFVILIFSVALSIIVLFTLIGLFRKD